MAVLEKFIAIKDTNKEEVQILAEDSMAAFRFMAEGHKGQPFTLYTEANYLKHKGKGKAPSISSQKKLTRFTYYNPNPLEKRTSDCVIRAFCKASGKDWDTVYQELCKVAFEVKSMPNDDSVWKPYIEEHLKFKAHKLRIQKGAKRPTAGSFAEEHPKGTFILSLANHLVTVHDGQIYDTWDCSSSAVYKYWEK